MEALVLSCSTGGGHNAAGAAVAEALGRRGVGVTTLDPYTLTGRSTERIVGDSYVTIACHLPELFGAIYQAGDLVRGMPGQSPVYLANLGMAKRLAEYLDEHPTDVIVMPHVFPAEMVTRLRKLRQNVPLSVFVATDYVCVPFTEETDCDRYITPSPALTSDFVGRGIEQRKLLPYGIPVKRAFSERIGREEALLRLGLPSDFRYLVIAGGSIGAGNLNEEIGMISAWMKLRSDYRLIVICGSNRGLYDRLEERYAGDERMILRASVDNMPDYLHAADIFLSKPGGLSSTEAAVANVPLIHLSPIPGCETLNRNFFTKRGMSLSADSPGELIDSLETLRQPEAAETMRDAQRRYIRPDGAERTAEFIIRTIQRREKIG